MLNLVSYLNPVINAPADLTQNKLLLQQRPQKTVNLENTAKELVVIVLLIFRRAPRVQPLPRIKRILGENTSRRLVVGVHYIHPTRSFYSLTCFR